MENWGRHYISKTKFIKKKYIFFKKILPDLKILICVSKCSSCSSCNLVSNFWCFIFDFNIQHIFLLTLISKCKVKLDSKLNLLWRRSLSYRNLSIDLQSKSMDWFPYDRDFHHERVQQTEYSKPCQTSKMECSSKTVNG